MDSSLDKQNRSSARMAIDGYVVVDDLLQADEIDRVAESLHGIDVDAAGDRRFLDREWCRLLAHVIRHRLLKLRLLYRASRPVLCTYFRTDAGSKRSLDLHRELLVPLAARADSTQFSNWTEKQGILHARATRALLATMLAVRVNVDDCASGDSELCVVPGSHTGADVDAERVACTAARGGAIVFSPLLLHASAPSVSPQPRRVLQFLFGPGDLPDGARWYY
jgi:hypothetical protein